MVNHFFSAKNKVYFVQIEVTLVEELVAYVKNLKEEVKRYYDGDDRLQHEVDEFVSGIQRMLGSIKSYSDYLEEIDSLLIKFFTYTMHPTYKNLQELYVKPIINNLKELRNQNYNGYKLKIEELCKEFNFLEETFVITRGRSEEELLIISEDNIRVYRDKDFVKLGITAKRLFFIGTPSFFDKKFSEMFFADETFFIGYSCFENSIKPTYSFANLISNKLLINTVYKNVDLASGHRGINYYTVIKQPLEQYDEEKILKRMEEGQGKQKGNIQARIVYISNNNFTFLPVDQSVTIIEKENFKIQQTTLKNLNIGDLLLFRTNSGSTLIREVADEILGHQASELRSQQEKWKKRLRSSIKKQGIDTVVRVLQHNYKISYVNAMNLSYWISPFCIKPDALEKMLEALKFEEEEKKEILAATGKIFAAHIKAGHKISKSLINEINGNMEEAIGEKGYYKFESKIFEGASFNIEEIKAISKQNIMVSENDILKVFKK